MKQKRMIATEVSFVAPFTMNGFTAGRRYHSIPGAYIWRHSNGEVFGINDVEDDDGKSRTICLVESSVFNNETLVARIEHEYDECAVIRKRNRYRRMMINSFADLAEKWLRMSKKQARAWGRMHTEPFFHNDGAVVSGTILADSLDCCKPWEVDQTLFDDVAMEEVSCW